MPLMNSIRGFSGAVVFTMAGLVRGRALPFFFTAGFSGSAEILSKSLLRAPEVDAALREPPARSLGASLRGLSLSRLAIRLFR